MRKDVPKIKRRTTRKFKNKIIRLPPNEKMIVLKSKLHEKSLYVKDYNVDWVTYWVALDNRALHTE